MATDAGIDPPYSGSCGAYVSLLLKPKIQGQMFKCTQDDWREQFEKWNIAYVW
eukprot:CAMPEP_0169111658 /NCGR_PEP_ID=MMETSP1015-20121227/27196_1 /TAXON_ID=342587 /ORGANISM="Karlodinium micrum, Strain CCMP2283" /LENGTH=52 /DNA_ID=CAMNT_0009173597 /DNA_START=41 /DNA_END=196 /DNA_ORIENTATION=+